VAERAGRIPEALAKQSTVASIVAGKRASSGSSAEIGVAITSIPP
jgi:hypothetical protein